MRKNRSKTSTTKKGKKATALRDLAARRGKNDLAASVKGGAFDAYARRRPS